MFNCVYCGKECKNDNSKRQHEIRCNHNPNRIIVKPTFGNLGKKGSNQYLKAIKLGLPKPEVSVETRKKISESTTKNNLNRGDSIKNKISEGMKKAHEEGRAWNIGMSRWNNEPSYPEKFFMEVIKNEFVNCDYIREFPIGKYSADFCWIYLKKVIEIDGEQHQRFKEYSERDKLKDIFLESLGYKILRISWKEMYNKPKEKILECYSFIHD